MANKYTFSGHESFPCKSLWLKKGYDFVVEGKDFNKPEAVIDLGVGKNMVAGIRYWLKVFGIIDVEGKVTELGNYLFDEEKGKDKYLEDLATLWLLHFTLVSLQEATLYNWVFCGLQIAHQQFSRDRVVTYVKQRLAEEQKLSQYSENSIKKDVAVLLQNYVAPQKSQNNEDYSSLLLDLDIIRQNKDDKDKIYYFNEEGKREIPKEIFLYALFKIKGIDNTVSYETIKEKVSLTFCMNDSETINMLMQLSEDYKQYLAYSDIAGIRQVQFIKEESPFQILNDYYENI